MTRAGWELKNPMTATSPVIVQLAERHLGHDELEFLSFSLTCPKVARMLANRSSTSDDDEANNARSLNREPKFSSGNSSTRSIVAEFRSREFEYIDAQGKGLEGPPLPSSPCAPAHTDGFSRFGNCDLC
jgi:hypothetical protein